MDLSACMPGVVLLPGAALNLAIALHELATNALKCSVLSVPEGRVSAACATDPGFWLRLLERGPAAQVGMRADIRFQPAGVRCTIHLPVPRPEVPKAER